MTLEILFIDGYGGVNQSVVAQKYFNWCESRLGRVLPREQRVGDTRYHVDAYDPQTNTAYEFLGC